MKSSRREEEKKRRREEEEEEEGKGEREREKEKRLQPRMGHGSCSGRSSSTAQSVWLVVMF